MTVRKAALDLVGRLPTADEVKKAQGGEASLDAVLRAMLEEPAFYDRLAEMTNDLLLTNHYLTDNGCNTPALNLLPADSLPGLGGYMGMGQDQFKHCCDGPKEDPPQCPSFRDFRVSANNAVAREAVNLYTYVVKNNRPFSEVLTANYVLVNQASAQVYSVDQAVKFSDPGNPNELQEAQATYQIPDAQKNINPTAYPHAGVLTTPVFLDRYPTTETNRNRHRARFVQKLFLGADILLFGTRPLDADAASRIVMTPTLNNSACVTCHKVNDPIAGAFQAWYGDMFPPGYEDKMMPASNYKQGPQWLSAQLVADPRFALGSVYFAYTALTGHEPLTFPKDPTDPLFTAKSQAWQVQDAVFRQIVEKFTKDNLNLKTVFVELVKSSYYRAVKGPAKIDEAGAAQLAGVGTGRLLTPEMLDRKVSAVLGAKWARDKDHDWLTSDYYFSYGGIDSYNVTKRVVQPNGIIAGVASRLANEMSCNLVPNDFVLPKEERRFFSGVELDSVPQAGGNDVPGNITRIRANIRQLHELLLGEQLEDNDPEVDRTFALFLAAWKTTASTTDISDACHATKDAQGNDLPKEKQINDDKNGTLRAWMAVTSYLLSDFKFLYE